MAQPTPRRGPALFSAGPLGVIAICFVLPCIKGCGSPVSPAAQILSASNPFEQVGWVAPPFALAGLLGALIVATRVLEWRGIEPAPPRETLGWRDYDLLVVAGIVPWVCSTPVFWLETIRDKPPFGIFMPAVGGAPIALGSFALARSIGASGWRRWTLLVAAYAGVATGSPVTMIFVSAAWSGTDLLYGGWLYLAALALLVPAAVAGLLLR